jgi:predicted transcriptional regulator
MTKVDLSILMTELLNKDRFDYLRAIEKTKDGATSLEITRDTLRSKGIPSTDEIQKENVKINKRLRNLVGLGILVLKGRGRYDLSSLGQVLIDTWRETQDRIETLEKFEEFFEDHYVSDIPHEFLRQIYRLSGAELTVNPVQWMKEVMMYMKRIERKFYNMTEYLHDIPEDILRKKVNDEIEDISILYQFKKYPQLNYSDESELFEKLVKAKAKFHYLTLENRHPVGIRIVDEKWATFGLARRSGGVLDRDMTLIGTDINFISWCRDLMYHMWHFEAKPLRTDEVIAKEQEK